MKALRRLPKAWQRAKAAFCADLHAHRASDQPEISFGWLIAGTIFGVAIGFDLAWSELDLFHRDEVRAATIRQLPYAVVGACLGAIVGGIAEFLWNRKLAPVKPSNPIAIVMIILIVWWMADVVAGVLTSV